MGYHARVFRSSWLPKAITLLLLGMLCRAQQNPPTLSSSDQQGQNSSFVYGPIHTDELELYAVVYDKHGHPVRRLALKDFAIYENGQRQKMITAFGPKGNKYFFLYKRTIPLSEGGIRVIKVKAHKRGLRVQAPGCYSAERRRIEQECPK